MIETSEKTSDFVIRDPKRQALLMMIVTASVFMFMLDYSMLNISLPMIARSFNVGVSVIAWVPLIYILTVTSTLLGFGKLGDIKGYKKIFILGLVFFVVGTALCSTAKNLAMLLSFRVIQCMGEAMFSPMGVALVTTCLPATMRGKGLGLVATAQGAGLCLGPAISGFINAQFNWHAIFLVNVPIGLATIFFAMKILPSVKVTAPRTRFDMAGAALISVTLSTLIFALNSITRMGLGNPVIIFCFAVSFVSAALFIWRENSVKYPIFDIELFRNSSFTFASLAAVSALFVYMGLSFMFPFYLEYVRGVDIMRTGLVLMLPALMLTVVSPVAGHLSDRIGSRLLCTAGMTVSTTALLIMAVFFKKDTPLPFIALTLMLAGFGTGMFFSPNNKLVMGCAPADRQGVVSGAYKILMNMGGVLGIAILPLVILRTIAVKMGVPRISAADLKHSPDMVMPGFSGAFKFCVLIAVLSMVFSALARDRKE